MRQVSVLEENIQCLFLHCEENTDTNLVGICPLVEQVILKIIKHCKDHSPSLVTGQLLGLDVGSVLEVTNCFPFPVCYRLSFSFVSPFFNPLTFPS